MKHAVIILLFLNFSLYGNLIAQSQLSSKSSRAVKLYQSAISKANLRYFDDAIADLKLAIEADSKFVEAYMLIGEICIDARQDNEAITYIKKSIQINPNFFPPIYYTLANLEFNNGLYDNALTDIKTFLLLAYLSNRRNRLNFF